MAERSRSNRWALAGSGTLTRWIAGVALAGTLAVGGARVLRPLEVATASAVKGPVAEVVYATGSVEPKFWAKVVSLQRKRIVELCRCEGKPVQKGEVLGRLDDVEERAVLTELEARYKRLREDADRLKALLDRNATTRTAYDDKLTQVREYEARIAAQKDRILDLELRAPMDGVVLRRDGEVGEIAGTGATDVLLWIGQPRPLRVVAEVNEEDIGRLLTGQKVLLRHDGYPNRTLPASVDSITPKGDPLTKTFRVYLALPDDTPLQIGMSVEANIVVKEVESALLVPAEAISDGRVIVVDGGRARRIPVTSGVRGSRLVEITGGLSEGLSVISPFRRDVADGQRVRASSASRP